MNQDGVKGFTIIPNIINDAGEKIDLTEGNDPVSYDLVEGAPVKTTLFYPNGEVWVVTITATKQP